MPIETSFGQFGQSQTICTGQVDCLKKQRKVISSYNLNLEILFCKKKRVSLGTGGRHLLSCLSVVLRGRSGSSEGEDVRVPTTNEPAGMGELPWGMGGVRKW